MKGQPVRMVADTERVEELCQGGTKPKADCKKCGDRLYAQITGFGGILPASYEGWREEHTRTGLPWAKERMLDHIQWWHYGVLNPYWKPMPVTKDSSPKRAMKYSIDIRGIFVMTILIAFLAIVAWAIV